LSKLSLENKIRLEKLATPTIANVLDDLGFAGIMNGLQPAGLGMRVVGQAITVQEITGPYGSFSVEDFKVGHMIDAASTGEVIVVANNGAEVSTWGGMASYSAKLKGIGGLVVDGGIRDREEIIKFEFPAFSRHMVPTPGKKRIKVLSIGEPIICASVKVRTGDIIVADGSGVLCIPIEHLDEVINDAEKYTSDDNQAMSEMKQGLTFIEALSKFKKI
jgi:regulator of RNase E activity RraA